MKKLAITQGSMFIQNANLPNKVHDVMTQKTVVFVVNAVNLKF